jgi:hypothetical protein
MRAPPPVRYVACIPCVSHMQEDGAVGGSDDGGGKAAGAASLADDGSVPVTQQQRMRETGKALLQRERGLSVIPSDQPSL